MNFHSQAAKHAFRNMRTIIRSPVPEPKSHFSNLKGERIEGREHVAIRYDLNTMFALPRQKLNDLETREPRIFLKKVYSIQRRNMLLVLSPRYSITSTHRLRQNVRTSANTYPP